MSKIEELGDRARQLRASGETWEAIGLELGVHADTAKCAADPEYALQRRMRNTLRRKTERRHTAPKKYNRIDDVRPTAEEAARAIASVPPDTRGLTSRVLGDPLPGRSALDQRMAPFDVADADMGNDVGHLLGKRVRP